MTTEENPRGKVEKGYQPTDMPGRGYQPTHDPNPQGGHRPTQQQQQTPPPPPPDE